MRKPPHSRVSLLAENSHTATTTRKRQSTGTWTKAPAALFLFGVITDGRAILTQKIRHLPVHTSASSEEILCLSETDYGFDLVNQNGKLSGA